MNQREGQRSLKILTIDGGGYQGISNLLILGNLMRAIAEQVSLDGQLLRPCDVFDVICGVGSGGWIALLLGRFMLSVSECHYEYCNIANAIIRPGTTKAKWSGRVNRSFYDMKRLRAYVDHLTQKYKTGPYLLATNTDNVVCKQTMVVASSGNLEYCLFRTYDSKDHGLGKNPDPATTLISDAFAATGAKRGFLYPCKLELGGAAVKFGHEIIPHCLTNATVIALDEAIRVYGEEPDILAVLNIGPGVPGAEDIKKIYSMVTRRISWGSTTSKSSKSSKGSEGSKSSDSSGKSRWEKVVGRWSGVSEDHHSIHGGSSHSSDTASDQHPPKPSPPTKQHRLHAFNCCAAQPEPDEVHQLLKHKQSSNLAEISNRVRDIDGTAVYVRLGPEDAPRDIAINDALGMAPERAQKTAESYLRKEEVKNRIEGLARRISKAMKETGDGVSGVDKLLY